MAFDYTRDSRPMKGNFDFERCANESAGKGTAQRVTRNYPPADTNRTQQNPQEGNHPNLNGPNAPREPIPTLNPPTNPREPTPTVNPPSNPREPIPTVTPRASQEPNPVRIRQPRMSRTRALIRRRERAIPARPNRRGPPRKVALCAVGSFQTVVSDRSPGLVLVRVGRFYVRRDGHKVTLLRSTVSTL